LVEVGRGKVVSVTVGGKTYAVKLGSDIKVSLGTKDPREAKERAKEATAQFDLVWGSLAAAPIRLTQKQCVALSKDIYDYFTVVFEDDPAAGVEWSSLREQERKLVSQYQRSPRKNLMIPPRRPVLRLLELAVDHCLSQRHLTIEDESRDRLMVEFDRSFGLATDLLVRRVDGDFGPDENEKRFPAFVPTANSVAEVKAAPADVLTLTSLLKHKAKSQTLKVKTVTMYEAVVRRFREFAGHEDARKLTSEEGRRWREHLVEAGLSKKTINDKYITSIKALLTHAVDEFDLPTNPVSGLRDKRADAPPNGPKGYTVEQAQAILQATFGGTTKALSVPHKRAVFWVPWICAYTGLRVSEVTQLRGKDLRWEGDIPYLIITPEAGSTKGNNAWTTGIHEHLIDLGLLAMFEAVGDGAVFYTPYPEGTDLTVLLGHRAKDAATDVGNWVMGVHGPAPGGRPNHAWRHAFTSLSRVHDMDKEARDYMMGSRSKVDAREGYGDWEPVVVKREINKLPRFEVSEKEWRPSNEAVPATPVRAVRARAKRVLRRPVRRKVTTI
jgi:integrase